MAYPATYNINYYKGDTLEFRVYPKHSDGTVFDLSDYDDVAFWISTQRGTAGIEDGHQCYSSISDDGTFILCAIRPADATSFAPGTQYVYDVEVTQTLAPYDKVYTLLTGTITVTDQVTGAF